MLCDEVGVSHKAEAGRWLPIRAFRFIYPDCGIEAEPRDL